MRRGWRTAAIMIAAVAGAAALPRCASPIPQVTPASLAAFDPAERVTLADLQEGRRLYVARCGGCHGLYAPAYGTEAEWRGWVREMAPRAHVDPARERLVLLFLRSGLHAPTAEEPR